MSWVAVAIGGSALIGYIGSQQQSDAAQSAANMQSRAAKDATSAQLQMYNQTRSDNEPWRMAGVGALNQMSNPEYQRDFAMSDFKEDPGYAFRMQEGQKALERSAAARGSLMSGGTLKALTNYGQGMGAQEYQSAFDRFNQNADRRYNRLASLAGVGQTATNQNSAAGQNYANQAGQNSMASANAQGAAAVAGANATSNALGQGANSWMQYQMMNKFFPATGG